MSPKEKPLGIGSIVGILLLAVSLDISGFLFDLVYIIPLAGWLIGAIMGLFLDVFGTVVFSLWFYYKGVKFVRNIGAAAIIESIPVFNALPAWTLAALLTISKANGYGIARRVLAVFGIKNKDRETSPVQKRPLPPTPKQEVPSGTSDGDEQSSQTETKPQRTNVAQFSDVKRGERPLAPSANDTTLSASNDNTPRRGRGAA